jgi:hypothetical protein
MLSWQVGRVKITRIVEMDLPVPASQRRQPPQCFGGDEERLTSAMWRTSSLVARRRADIRRGDGKSCRSEVDEGSPHQSITAIGAASPLRLRR